MTQRKTLFDQGMVNSVLDDRYFVSPKYSANPRDTSTMARLFIPMTPEEAKLFRNTLQRELKGALNDIINALVVEVGDNILGGGYLYFLMTAADEALQEKVQVIETMSDDYVAYAFGSSPPVFSYSGILPNTLQDDWRIAFLLLYRFLIRASQLARYRKSVVLSYDNLYITGSFMSQRQVLSAESQTHAQLSFQILVKKITVLSRTDIRSSGENSRAEEAGVFDRARKGLLGLIASVSGSGAVSVAPLATAADIPRREAGDTPPTEAASILNIKQSVAEESYKSAVLGKLYPVTGEYDLDAPIVE